MVACMTMHDLFDAVAVVLETIGVLSMIVGFIVAFTVAGRRLLNRQGGSFTLLRTTLGGSILLGLEILVAADLIRTVAVEPTVQNVAILGLIVLIRTFLSFSLEIEIEGIPPWRRALVGGGRHLAEAVSRATDTAARN